MFIAIHKSERKGYFSERWIEYCQNNNIPFKIVDCYKNTIIDDLDDCYALMWHFSHADSKDYLFAKQLIFAVETKGLLTFPNYNSCWHFDDKVAQKYLLEGINAQLAPSYVFYSESDAIQWATDTVYPKVFKLRGGSSSANVKLVLNKKKAINLISRAFGRGFRQFNRYTLFFDTFNKYRNRKSSFIDLIASFGKIFISSKYEKVRGKEAGYAYFQDFYPSNSYDIRVIVIGNKAFAIKRINRNNDFRASGSGLIIYDKEQIDMRCIQISFDVTNRLSANCLAFDYIYNDHQMPVLLEISFGFMQAGYDNCQGYWDTELNWHEGQFCQENWMVDDIVHLRSQKNRK